MRHYIVMRHSAIDEETRNKLQMSTEGEKKFWKKIDRDNKIYQSNKALIVGAFFIVFFSYQFVKLGLYFSSYEKFRSAVQSTEKARSLGLLLAIVVGILLMWLGIRIRKTPIVDFPREKLLDDEN